MVMACLASGDCWSGERHPQASAGGLEWMSVLRHGFVEVQEHAGHECPRSRILRRCAGGQGGQFFNRAGCHLAGVEPAIGEFFALGFEEREQLPLLRLRGPPRRAEQEGVVNAAGVVRPASAGVRRRTGGAFKPPQRRVQLPG